MSGTVRLPDPPTGEEARRPEEWERWGRDLVRNLEQALDDLGTQSGVGWEVTNLAAANRTLDVTAAAGAADLAALKVVVEDLAEVVGTLINDLKNRIIG